MPGSDMFRDDFIRAVEDRGGIYNDRIDEEKAEIEKVTSLQSQIDKLYKQYEEILNSQADKNVNEIIALIKAVNLSPEQYRRIRQAIDSNINPELIEKKPSESDSYKEYRFHLKKFIDHDKAKKILLREKELREDFINEREMEI